MIACRMNVLVAVLAACGAGCGGGRVDHPAVGRVLGPLPVVPLGHEADPPRFTGQVTLLNFWATWCPPCRRELPGLARLAARLANEPRFRLVAVNVGSGDDDPAALATETREFLTVQRIPLAAWAFADPLGRALVSDTLGVAGIPATFLVGPDARVRRAWVGFRSGDEADMSRAVLAALQEQPASAAAP
jgi:thiol-disulfide isomerase/thioredoxin